MKKVIFLIILVGVIIIAGIGISTLKNGNKKSTEVFGNSGIIVEASSIKVYDDINNIVADGKIEALDQHEIYADFSDKIKIINVRVGDKVKKGDIIMTFYNEEKEKKQNELNSCELEIKNLQLEISRLKNPDEEIDIEKLNNEIANINAKIADNDNSIGNLNSQIDNITLKLENATEDYNTKQELVDNGILAENELTLVEETIEDYKLQINQLNSQIKSFTLSKEANIQDKEVKKEEINKLVNAANSEDNLKQIQIKENEVKMKENEYTVLQNELNKIKTELVSPIDGTIAEVEVTENQYVTADTTKLVKIIGNQNQIIHVDLPSEDATSICIGQKCNIKYFSNETISFDGEVLRIAPEVEEQEKANGSIKKVVPVEVKYTNNEINVINGAEVEVDFVLQDNKEVASIPEAAIFNQQNNDYIYVINSKNKVETKKVSILKKENELAIVQGLNNDDLIIESEIDNLTENMEVRYKLKQ